jgi:hypothetical protein
MSTANFQADSDEDEDEEDEDVVKATVVQGEADEDEDEDEDEDGEQEEPIPTPEALPAAPVDFYPGLQLPTRRTANSTANEAEESSSEGETDDYSSLFANSKFAYPAGGDAGAHGGAQEYYYSTDLQRKVSKQNIRTRQALAERMVQTLLKPRVQFQENVGSGISESILIAQDIAQNTKNANEDLIALTDKLAELKSFPASIFA